MNEQDEMSSGMEREVRGLSTGAPAFRESFNERLRRLYREKSDLMNQMVRLERDIVSIENILGSR